MRAVTIVTDYFVVSSIFFAFLRGTRSPGSALVSADVYRLLCGFCGQYNTLNTRGIRFYVIVQLSSEMR